MGNVRKFLNKPQLPSPKNVTSSQSTSTNAKSLSAGDEAIYEEIDLTALPEQGTTHESIRTHSTPATTRMIRVPTPVISQCCFIFTYYGLSHYYFNIQTYLVSTH